MPVLRLFAVAALATALTAAPAHAQTLSLTRTAGTPVASGAPVATRMSVGVQRVQFAPAPVAAPKTPRADTRQNRAMMIVGGAAMLTGAVVGGDGGGLISVGGAVVFLWGLYQFLQ